MDFSYEENKQQILQGLRGATKKKLNSRLRKIVKAIPAGCSVLDVACGIGRVLQAATENGCTGKGIELSPPAVAVARESGLDVMQGDVDSFDTNPSIENLLLSRYDVVVFSKCLMYFKSKNELMKRLDTHTIIIFQINPGHWKFRLNGERSGYLKHDEQIPYKLKTGEVIVIGSSNDLIRWGASYGFTQSKVIQGGMRHRSMIVEMSRPE